MVADAYIHLHRDQGGLFCQVRIIDGSTYLRTATHIRVTMLDVEEDFVSDFRIPGGLCGLSKEDSSKGSDDKGDRNAREHGSNSKRGVTVGSVNI